MLSYLRSTDGPDAGKDWSRYIEPAEALLVELEALSIPSKWDATVPQAVLDVFARAADLAKDVMTTTKIDEPPNKVRVSHRLLQLESEASAGARPPAVPYET